MNKNCCGIFFLLAISLALFSCSGDEEDSVGNLCGGILPGHNCKGNTFCSFEEGTCGAADQIGTCVAIPEVCTAIFSPVCGCDEVTYSNQCQAEAVGVSIFSRGDCPK